MSVASGDMSGAQEALKSERLVPRKAA